MPVFSLRNISRPDINNPDAWFSYKCGYCQSKISGAVIAYYENRKWLMCPECGEPSVLSQSTIHPTTIFGPNIDGIPEEVKKAYEEARICISSNALTACELICRKILMHIAVDKGAKEGESFVSYINYLQDNHYITPIMKNWVDTIRQIGNDATHKLEPPNMKRAESTIMFTAELLRLVYEMDYLTKQYTSP